MSDPRTPAGTRVFMQSEIAAAQALSAITKANPAVISYAGADPTNANYVALTSMFGMTEFEDALVKVANVNAAGNTFEAEDQDSTLFGTFVSGNMQVVTLGLEFLNATGISFQGGEQNFARYFLMRDTMQRSFPSTHSGVTMNMKTLFDPADAGSKEILRAARAKSKRGFKVLWPDGLEMLFFGYVAASGLPNADNMEAVIESPVSVVMSTLPIYILP